MLLGFIEELNEFAVLEETYGELLEDKLDIARIEVVIERLAAGEIERRESILSPRMSLRQISMGEPSMNSSP